MNVWFLLGFAIVAEVIGTTALKMSDGFTKFWPALIVVIGYGLAFYLLSLTLKHIPVGVAYAVWSGVGIALITLIGWAVFSQTLDWAAWVGIGLIISGVLVLQVFSSSAGH
ncbi:SMR family transporter [Thiomicrospira sp.]|uniref:SMR family transporter n=1 Tax=Thiomicrospira sp. TaxID=935 RepID=UPI002F935B3B